MCENMSNLCKRAGVKERKRAAHGWERVNEGLRFMQSPYYSVNTQSVSLHIREQNSSEILLLGVIQLPFPHTHTFRDSDCYCLRQRCIMFCLSRCQWPTLTRQQEWTRSSTETLARQCVWIKYADQIRHVELPKYILGICWAAGVLSFGADGSFTLTVISVTGGQLVTSRHYYFWMP